LYGSILRIAKLLNLKSCHNSLPSEWVAAVRRLVNREIKETGTSEDVPRTAAITQIAGEKKAPANAWHCCAVIYLGLPSPVAELAATKVGYRADPVPATSENPLLRASLASGPEENIPTAISEWPDNNPQRSVLGCSQARHRLQQLVANPHKPWCLPRFL
jgi:hypothetical protein